MSGAWLKEPNCYTCGRTRTRCIEMRIWEEAHGVPDPHDFETLEDAERNRACRQIDAKARARADLEDARSKSKWQDDPAFELPERRIQEPEPEETPT